MSDRAIQFAPFAALKGYYELIRERERVVVDKKELMEDGAELLSEKLLHIKIGMMLKIIHYSEGEYISTEGVVTVVDFENRYITVVKNKILFDDIYDITGLDADI